METTKDDSSNETVLLRIEHSTFEVIVIEEGGSIHKSIRIRVKGQNIPAAILASVASYYVLRGSHVSVTSTEPKNETILFRIEHSTFEVIVIEEGGSIHRSIRICGKEQNIPAAILASVASYYVSATPVLAPHLELKTMNPAA